MILTLDYLLLVQFPLRLGNGQNDRKAWQAAIRQKRAEKEFVAWHLAGNMKPPTPCTVTLTRIAPGNGLDSDNNVAACKYVRDAIAVWIGVDDKDEAVVAWRYGQEKGPWGVRVEIRT